MRRHFLYYLIFSIMFIYLLVFPAKSNAQLPSIVVYPSYIELDFARGSRNFVTKVVNVENPTKNIMRIRASMQDWTLTDNSVLTFLEKPGENSLQNFIKFNPIEFELAPGQKQQVRITAKLPEGTEGEYRTMIFFESVLPKEDLLKPDKTKISVALSYAIRFGVVLYAYKGNVSRNALLEKVKYEFGKDSKKPELVATLKNEGNIHTILVSSVDLKSDSESISKDTGKYSILPGKTQNIIVQLPDKEMKPGNYTAKLKLTYKDIEEKEQVLEAETTFNYEGIKASEVKQQLEKPIEDENVEKTPDNIAKPLPPDTSEIKLTPVPKAN